MARMTLHAKPVLIGLGGTFAGLAAVNAWLASGRRRRPTVVARSQEASPAIEPGVRVDNATRDELYEVAKRMEIPGRSRMKKADLERAIAERTAEPTFV